MEGLGMEAMEDDSKAELRLMVEEPELPSAGCGGAMAGR